MTVTIYHNPACGTSRNTLDADLGLGDPKWSDDEIVDFMMAHPILINRPIVLTEKGAVLARPAERVLEILPNPHIGDFVKEDGEIVRTGTLEAPRPS